MSRITQKTLHLLHVARLIYDSNISFDQVFGVVREENLHGPKSVKRGDNSFPADIVLALPKLKAFADDKFNVTPNMKNISFVG